MKKTTTCYALILWLFAISAAHSAPAWVSDEFEITLRTGPSTSNSIQLMVGSGTQLEVLERDSESGYSRVRTSAGTEGWVLSRYLMDQPSARAQIEKLAGQLTSTNTRGTSLGSQLAAVRNEYNSAKRQISMLENEKSALESELAEIRRAAADVLGINQQNKNLMDELATEKIRADKLVQENRQLSSQTTRYWFMSGALVLLVGILLGIWVPRIRWRRRSGYDRF
jgi:SH3 domain protein